MTVSRTRLLASLIVGIVAASLASILIRLAQGAGMAPLAIAAWRLIFASAILIPYAWLRRRDELRDLSGAEWRLMAVAGLLLGLHFATWITSLRYTSVASAVVLVSMGPLFVAIGSWLIWRERPGGSMVVGITIALVGTIIIAFGDFSQGDDVLMGDLLALAGAVFIAGYLMAGRRIRNRRSLTTYVAVVYGMAMVTQLILVLIARQSLFGYSAEAYGWSLALAIGPQIIGHSAFNWALGYLTATFVSIVTLAEPIGSSVLAYVILGEAVTRSTFAGGVLVLLGIYIASRAELN
jgi:drug/metabolite transporter (DMT)-like permease